MKKKIEVWPVAIIISFLLFAGLIFGSMYVMMNQRVDLVSEDYYAREVAFQDQIDKTTQTQVEGKTPQFEVDRTLGLMTIGFQVEANSGTQPEGTIHFFRPSNADMDQTWEVKPDASGRMLIPLQTFQKGYWRVRIEWEEAGKAFYHEEEIMV